MTGYLLDTNVVSELIKPSPDARVAAWIRLTEEADAIHRGEALLDWGV